MLPPFSTGNTIGSGVFPDATNAGISVDKNVANIWSTTPGVTEARPVQPVDRRPTWGGSYQGQQVPEFQPSWASYQAGHHMQEARAWSEHEQHASWRRNGSQQQQQPGVWNYPAEGYHPEWNGGRASQQQSSAGYYYVPHQRQEEYIIPYDIGARRGGYPPAPPGYPLPPHMQYYGGAAPTHFSPSSPYTVAPTVAPTVAGAASFLFEAAAAAKVEEQADLPKPVEQEPARKPAPAPAAPPAGRVNNHQVRLHSSGNEKAPLATAPVHAASVTTLMIRNIPNRYSQSELLMEIREAGFDAKFDFFYLPMDHETHANFGYAFINFVDEREVEPFTKRFNGLKLNRFTSNKIIQIVPAQLQGFQANLQHYCKKAVCTDDNIDYRPLFFVDGKCLEFHRASDFADAVKAKNDSVSKAAAKEERTEERPRVERGNKPFQKRRS